MGACLDLNLKVEEGLVSSIKKEIRVYTDTEDLLNEFQIEEVTLANYRNLFLIYLAFLFSVLIVFVLYKKRHRIKKLFSRFYRRLQLYVYRL